MTVYLLRGIVGSGKTTVRERLAEKLDAQEISTDNVREMLPFLRFTSGMPGHDLQADAKINMAFMIMYNAVVRRGKDAYAALDDVLGRVPEAEALETDKKEAIRLYLDQMLADGRENVVCEAPFHPSYYLDFFHDNLQPAPVLIEVQAPDKLICRRLRARAKKNVESRATLPIYLDMLKTWQPSEELHYDPYVIVNKMSRRGLAAEIDRVLKAMNSAQD
jgi:predicted kinase